MEAMELGEARVVKTKLGLPARTPAAMDGTLSGRGVAAALFATGFGAFLGLYAPQPMLPRFREIFQASELWVSLTVGAPVLAVALAAPLVGALADSIGRKRIIVGATLGLAIPMLLAATSQGLPQLILWRFLQGIFTPGIIAVTMAYISEESPRERTGFFMASYVSGTVAGGFCGRILAGFIAEHAGWREAFLALGLLTLAMAATTWAFLPRSTRFKKQNGIAKTLQGIRAHLGNKQLMAVCLAGFTLLFTLAGVFTYVNFYLADAPFHLSPGALSLVFTVYLAGVFVTPAAGRLMDKIGCRRLLFIAAGSAACGILLTLVASVPVVIAGLTLMAVGAFAAQTAASSQVGKAAGSARSSAAGLYVAFYYFGGCVGSVAPGVIWHHAGWLGCAIIMLCVQAFTATLAFTTWKD